ncbi:MAG: glycosyltransferase family 4 protein [Pirellulaceae bacterium]|nr:glycosyltransferase family 4 protein [Pirellulaceae bacterium]
MGFRAAVAGPADASGDYQGIALISIFDPTRIRWFRHRVFAWIRVCWWALFSKFRIFHFHDPDLIPAGIVLRLFGRKVIYDVHDDYQATFQLLTANRWWLRNWFPSCWWRFERTAARLFNGVIVADRHLAQKFQACRPIVLGNFPRLDFTNPADTSHESTFNVLYVGGVTRERGLKVALDSLKTLPQQDIRLHVIGPCHDQLLLQELSHDPRVVVHGRLNWTELSRHYERAHIGLALYQPLPIFLYCTGENAVKIIEYMAAGIPVLSADFPGLRAFVSEAGVGLVVDPQDAVAVAGQIQRLYSDRELLSHLGRRGRELFESEYHWEKHEPKLAELYRQVSN